VFLTFWVVFFHRSPRDRLGRAPLNHRPQDRCGRNDCDCHPRTEKRSQCLNFSCCSNLPLRTSTPWDGLFVSHGSLFIMDQLFPFFYFLVCKQLSFSRPGPVYKRITGPCSPTFLCCVPHPHFGCQPCIDLSL